MTKQNQSTVDSYFPTYHCILKATHLLNRNTGEYLKFPEGQKLIFLYMLDRYKFFKSNGGEYFDNQDQISEACSSVRRTVFSTIKLLQKCGYLIVTSKKTFQHRSNSYVFVSELNLAVIKKNTIEWEHKTNFIDSCKLIEPQKKVVNRPKFIPKTAPTVPDWDESDLPF